MGKKKNSVKSAYNGPFAVFSISGGIGKNIMATAVIASIKKQFPKHKIVVVTAYPEVYLNNPKIYRVYKFGNTPYFMENYVHDDTLVMQSDPYHDDSFIHKKKHLIKSWCEIYGIKCVTKQPEIYLTDSEIDFAKQRFTRRKPLFVVQTTGGGATSKSLQYSWARDLHPSQAQKIVDKMNETHNVIQIKKPKQPGLKNCESVFAPLRELFALIAISDKRLFIDSFAFHCATAFKLPSTVCWVGTKPEVYSNKIHTNITPKGKKKFIHTIDKYMEDSPWAGEKLYECPYDIENIFSVPKIIASIKKQPKNKNATVWEERKFNALINKSSRELSKQEKNQGMLDQMIPGQETNPMIQNKKTISNHEWVLAALSQNYLKKVNLDYAFSTSYGFHRGGWDYALMQLQYLNHPDGVKVDGLIENKFFWGNYPGDANNNPTPHTLQWVGFTHTVTEIPDCFEKGASPKEIFKTDLWKDSVKNCRGLFCLSEYHKKLLEKEIDIPIEVLTLPAQTPRIRFNFEKFKENKNKRIVQIGYWLRKLNSIYQLKTKKLKKTMLISRKDGLTEKVMEKERKKLGIKINKKSVDVLDYLSDEDYDRLLSENIVFIDLYDTASNNVIVECIVRNTPILTNPHPATIEYLGKDYPLYFKDLKEAEKKANDMNLIEDAYNYLRKMDKRKFNEKNFIDSFANSKIYKSLPDATKIREEFIDNYFDKIYYINLDKRVDRREELKEELKEANINTAMRMPGIEITDKEFKEIDSSYYKNFRGLKTIEDKEKFEKEYIKASIGVRRAHLNCIKDAKKKGYKKILILEDDIVIDKNVNAKFYRIINEVGDNWQLLYLGGDYWGGNVTFQLSSYALDASLFDYIIENMENSGMEDDFFFVEQIQKNFSNFRATPMLMWQTKKDSDIPTKEILITEKKKTKNKKSKDVKMKHIIAMPFWNASEVENFENLSKIWHLFDTNSVDYEFLLVARGDCDADTTKLEENLSKIKKVTKFVCPSEVLTKDHKIENSMNMFIDSSEFILQNYEKDGGFFLWFEGDMIPTSKDWLEKIHQEWIESNVKLMGYQITYQRSGSRNLVQHMNGGGCYSKDLLDLITKESIIDGVVFDLNILGEIIKAGYGFKDSNLWDFRLDYKCKPMKMKKSFRRGKVIMHGPKDKKDYNRFLKMLKDKCDKK
jgi:hypothetical protein